MTTPASSPARQSYRPAWQSPANVLFFAVVAAAVAADLWLKAWSFGNVAGIPVAASACEGAVLIPPHPPRAIIPGVLSLKLTTNTGAVFGIGRGSQSVFIAISLLAILIVVISFARSDARNHLLHLALALILAGAMGNLYDRVRFGAVRDMLYLFPGVHLPAGWTWPGTGLREVYPWIFNLADVALICGVVLVLVLSWRQPRPKPAAE